MMRVCQTSTLSIQLAGLANQTATGVLDNATSISMDAEELARNVSTTADKVDRLEQTVREDQETIAMTLDTAKETIAAANNITEQIVVIQVRRRTRRKGG